MKVRKLVFAAIALSLATADLKVSPACAAGATCGGLSTIFLGVFAAEKAFHSIHEDNKKPHEDDKEMPLSHEKSASADAPDGSASNATFGTLNDPLYLEFDTCIKLQNGCPGGGSGSEVHLGECWDLELNRLPSTPWKNGRAQTLRDEVGPIVFEKSYQLDQAAFDKVYPDVATRNTVDNSYYSSNLQETSEVAETKASLSISGFGAKVKGDLHSNSKQQVSESSIELTLDYSVRDTEARIMSKDCPEFSKDAMDKLKGKDGEVEFEKTYGSHFAYGFKSVWGINLEVTVHAMTSSASENLGGGVEASLTYLGVTGEAGFSSESSKSKLNENTAITVKLVQSGLTAADKLTFTGADTLKGFKTSYEDFQRQLDVFAPKQPNSARVVLRSHASCPEYQKIKDVAETKREEQSDLFKVFVQLESFNDYLTDKKDKQETTRDEHFAEFLKTVHNADFITDQNAKGLLIDEVKNTLKMVKGFMDKSAKMEFTTTNRFSKRNRQEAAELTEAEDKKVNDLIEEGGLVSSLQKVSSCISGIGLAFDNFPSFKLKTKINDKGLLYFDRFPKDTPEGVFNKINVLLKDCEQVTDYKWTSPIESNESQEFMLIEKITGPMEKYSGYDDFSWTTVPRLETESRYKQFGRFLPCGGSKDFEQTTGDSKDFSKYSSWFENLDCSTKPQEYLEKYIALLEGQAKLAAGPILFRTQASACLDANMQGSGFYNSKDELNPYQGCDKDNANQKWNYDLKTQKLSVTSEKEPNNINFLEFNSEKVDEYGEGLRTGGKDGEHVVTGKKLPRAKTTQIEQNSLNQRWSLILISDPEDAHYLIANDIFGKGLCLKDSRSMELCDASVGAQKQQRWTISHAAG